MSRNRDNIINNPQTGRESDIDPNVTDHLPLNGQNATSIQPQTPTNIQVSKTPSINQDNSPILFSRREKPYHFLSNLSDYPVTISGIQGNDSSLNLDNAEILFQAMKNPNSVIGQKLLTGRALSEQEANDTQTVHSKEGKRTFKPLISLINQTLQREGPLPEWILRSLRRTTDLENNNFKTSQNNPGDTTQLKVKIMEEILLMKATQNPDILRQLLATRNRQIINNTPLQAKYNDNFWGKGKNNKGQNHLGKAWMRVRNTLDQEQENGGIRRRDGFSARLVAELQNIDSDRYSNIVAQPNNQIIGQTTIAADSVRLPSRTAEQTPQSSISSARSGRPNTQIQTGRETSRTATSRRRRIGPNGRRRVPLRPQPPYTNYLYTTNDIDNYINREVANIGGFESINSSDPNSNVTIPTRFLADRHDLTDQARAPNGYRVLIAPAFAADHENEDSFRATLGNIIPSIKDADIPLRILFPYNNGGRHWLTGEIEIFQDLDRAYKVEMTAHDPYGVHNIRTNNPVNPIIQSSPGFLADSLAEVVKESIVQRFNRANSNIIINEENIESFDSEFHSTRQNLKDGSSCGLIVSREIIARITGQNLDRNSPYPNGCSDQREADLEGGITSEDRILDEISGRAAQRERWFHQNTANSVRQSQETARNIINYFLERHQEFPFDIFANATQQDGTIAPVGSNAAYLENLRESFKETSFFKMFFGDDGSVGKGSLKVDMTTLLNIGQIAQSEVDRGASTIGRQAQSQNASSARQTRADAPEQTNTSTTTPPPVITESHTRSDRPEDTLSIHGDSTPPVQTPRQIQSITTSDENNLAGNNVSMTPSSTPPQNDNSGIDENQITTSSTTENQNASSARQTRADAPEQTNTSTTTPPPVITESRTRSDRPEDTLSIHGDSTPPVQTPRQIQSITTSDENNLAGNNVSMTPSSTPPQNDNSGIDENQITTSSTTDNQNTSSARQTRADVPEQTNTSTTTPPPVITESRTRSDRPENTQNTNSDGTPPVQTSRQIQSTPISDENNLAGNNVSITPPSTQPQYPNSVLKMDNYILDVFNTSYNIQSAREKMSNIEERDPNFLMANRQRIEHLVYYYQTQKEEVAFIHKRQSRTPQGNYVGIGADDNNFSPNQNSIKPQGDYVGIGADARGRYDDDRGCFVFTIVGVDPGGKAEAQGLVANDIIAVRAPNGSDKSLIRALNTVRINGVTKDIDGHITINEHKDTRLYANRAMSSGIISYDADNDSYRPYSFSKDPQRQVSPISELRDNSLNPPSQTMA